MKSPCLFVLVVLISSHSIVCASFTTVLNVPPQVAPTSIDSDTQLNLSSGGSLLPFFSSGNVDGSSTNIEVNISGGTVGHHFFAYAGSTVNVSGGSMGSRFTLIGSTANISGGSFGRDYIAGPNSVTNIFGGVVQNEIHTQEHATINYWGGTINFFQVHNLGRANFFGSEFYLDGAPITQLNAGEEFVVTDRNVTFSGILSDGSAFDYFLTPEEPDQGGADVDAFEPGSVLTVTLLHTADFDKDLDVDDMDLAIWNVAYGVNDSADADGDGDSDGADLLEWQRQYTGSLGSVAASVAVPEPNVVVLLLSAYSYLLFVRPPHTIY